MISQMVHIQVAIQGVATARAKVVIALWIATYSYSDRLNTTI